MIELFLLIVDLLFIGMYRSAKLKYRESEHYDITKLAYNQMFFTSILIGVVTVLLALCLLINALSSGESYEQPTRYRKPPPKTFEVYSSPAQPAGLFFVFTFLYFII